jgi:hypothetical protein
VGQVGNLRADCESQAESGDSAQIFNAGASGVAGAVAVQRRAVLGYAVRLMA